MNSELATKILSAVTGLVVIALAIFAPAGTLTPEARSALLVGGGGLLFLPVNPWKGTGGGTVTALALFLLVPSLHGCGGAQLPDPKAITDKAEESVAKAQAEVNELAAKVAEAKRKALKTAKDTIAAVTLARSLANAAGVVPKEVDDRWGIALGYAETTLARFERGEQVARDELLSAVDAVGMVVKDLRHLGREIEPLVDSSLDLVRTAVESAGG